MIKIVELTEKEKHLHELHYQELVIQDAIQGDLPLENGQLDFSQYDQLMRQLREVRAEMAALG